MGDGSETRIPPLSRPATQATESNKGVSCDVMLLCWINSRVKNNIVVLFKKLDKYNITGKNVIICDKVTYDRQKETKWQIILAR